jgi:hypothetical protein
LTVCTDEEADVSNKERLPLALQFVDEAIIREGFIACESHGQGYVMGLVTYKGTTATIRDSYPKATMSPVLPIH